MIPYKQYSEEVISGVLSGVVNETDVDSEDYPCSVTMERWRKEEPDLHRLCFAEQDQDDYHKEYMIQRSKVIRHRKLA